MEVKFQKSKNPKQLKQNNVRENLKMIPHNYKVGDEVLIKQDQNSKFGSNPYKGPFLIKEVRNKGTIESAKVSLKILIISK